MRSVPKASRRRKDLLELLERMNPTIEELTAAVEREARKWPEVLRLMTHPGVGPLKAGLRVDCSASLIESAENFFPRPNTDLGSPGGATLKKS